MGEEEQDLQSNSEYWRDLECICHKVNVDKSGFFTNPRYLIVRIGNEDEMSTRVHKYSSPQILKKEFGKDWDEWAEAVPYLYSLGYFDREIKPLPEAVDISIVA